MTPLPTVYGISGFRSVTQKSQPIGDCEPTNRALDRAERNSIRCQRDANFARQRALGLELELSSVRAAAAQSEVVIVRVLGCLNAAWCRGELSEQTNADLLENLGALWGIREQSVAEATTENT